MTQEIVILSQYIEENGEIGNRWEIICSSLGIGDPSKKNSDKDECVGGIAELENTIRNNFYILGANRPYIQVDFNAVMNFPAQCRVSISNPPREFIHHIQARQFIIYIGYSYVLNGNTEIILEPLMRGQQVLPSQVYESENTTEFIYQMNLGTLGHSLASSEIRVKREQTVKDVIVGELGSHITFSTDETTQKLLEQKIIWNPIGNIKLTFDSFKTLMLQETGLVIDNLNDTIVINQEQEKEKSTKEKGTNYPEKNASNNTTAGIKQVKNGSMLLWNDVAPTNPFSSSTCLRSRIAFVDENMSCDIALAFVIPQLTKYGYCHIDNVGTNIEIMSAFKIDGWEDKRKQTLQFLIAQNSIRFDTMGKSNSQNLRLKTPIVMKQ